MGDKKEKNYQILAYVLFVQIPFTAKPAGLVAPHFLQADPKLAAKQRFVIKN
jgi:hypothetical protein